MLEPGYYFLNLLCHPLTAYSCAFNSMNKKWVAARNLLQPSIGRVFRVLLRGHQRLNGMDHRKQSPVAHPRLKQFTSQTDFECGCGHQVFKLTSRTFVSHQKPFVLAPQRVCSRRRKRTFWLQHAPRKKTFLSIRENRSFAPDIFSPGKMVETI